MENGQRSSFLLGRPVYWGRVQRFRDLALFLTNSQTEVKRHECEQMP
jgi:hypothetical protein